jgi:hypothetical protein
MRRARICCKNSAETATSTATSKTIGIVVVAAFAASAGGAPSATFRTDRFFIIPQPVSNAPLGQLDAP